MAFSSLSFTSVAPLTAPCDSLGAECGVKGLLKRIDELTLENTGTFWHANGEVLPW